MSVIFGSIGPSTQMYGCTFDNHVTDSNGIKNRYNYATTRLPTGETIEGVRLSKYPSFVCATHKSVQI